MAPRALPTGLLMDSANRSRSLADSSHITIFRFQTAADMFFLIPKQVLSFLFLCFRVNVHLVRCHPSFRPFFCSSTAFLSSI